MNRTELIDDMLDVLVSGDTERILAFKLPSEKQERLSELLEKNREDRLTKLEKGELDSFEHVEHVVRLLKARLLQSSQS